MATRFHTHTTAAALAAGGSRAKTSDAGVDSPRAAALRMAKALAQRDAG